MAKELPYFKFFVSEWSDGDITLEDYEVQGLFINICSYYWSKDCNVSLNKLRKRFKGCDKSIDILLESDIMRVDEGDIKIKFLLEQLAERGELSNKNSLNARKRWDAIKAAKGSESKKDASVLPSHCESNAIKRREEEDKRRKEKNKLNSDEEFVFSEFKRITEKNIRVFDKKAKSNLKARLDEGYTKEDIILAISNCKNNPYHIEHPEFLTLEFILRPDKLSKYIASQVVDSNGNYKKQILPENERVKLTIDQEWCLNAKLVEAVAHKWITLDEAIEEAKQTENLTDDNIRRFFNR